MLSLKEKWLLRLYVAGPGRLALRARANLERLCQQHIEGRYRIDVVDLHEHPSLAGEHSIVALPLVVRESPVPIRKMVGDFSDPERALSLLLLGPSPRSLLHRRA